MIDNKHNGREILNSLKTKQKEQTKNSIKQSLVELRENLLDNPQENLKYLPTNVNLVEIPMKNTNFGLDSSIKNEIEPDFLNQV